MLYTADLEKRITDAMLNLSPDERAEHLTEEIDFNIPCYTLNYSQGPLRLRVNQTSDNRGHVAVAMFCVGQKEKVTKRFLLRDKVEMVDDLVPVRVGDAHPAVGFIEAAAYDLEKIGSASQAERLARLSSVV